MNFALYNSFISADVSNSHGRAEKCLLIKAVKKVSHKSRTLNMGKHLAVDSIVSQEQMIVK